MNMSMMMTSIFNTVIIAGISAVLAAIIAIMDAIVNNYGPCDININDAKKQLTIKGGTNLLVTLADQRIFIPSACGGKGTCGECMLRISSDVGPHLPTEIPHLNKEQIERNMRLSCQIKVRGNLDIEIPEHLFNVREYTGTVEKIVDVTHDIKEVLIKLPEEISFKSGQYCQLEAPKYAKVKELTQRAYSLSSVPSDKNHAEFLVRLVPGGVVTTYVHDYLKEGSTIKVIGPFGEFYVRDTKAPMICVAGGSGMAPFKSILKDYIEQKKMDERDIWYFFGAVKLRDMYYVEWLQEMDRTYPRFHFVPALSEPDPDTAWSGEEGLITEVLDRYLREKIANEQKEGYLCGSPGMLDACMAVMRTHEMTDDKIYFDKFS